MAAPRLAGWRASGGARRRTVINRDTAPNDALAVGTPTRSGRLAREHSLRTFFIPRARVETQYQVGAHDVTRLPDCRVLTVVVVSVIIALSVSAPAATAAAAGTETADRDVTFVESDITTETTWAAADGPYRIVRDIEIASGATLTVGPGTSVELAEDITVTVNGSLRTDGTAARPVTVTRSDGAATDRRWGTLRYNGTASSTLKLRHTTLRGGTTGITVASGDGRVEVVDSTVRDFTAGGLAVTGTTVTPAIAVERSTFRGIGDHALEASPAAGAVDRASLTAAPDRAGSGATHTLTLQPGVGVSFDSISLAYDADGSVASVGGGDIRRIGVDRDRDGDIDRSLAGSVASVSATASRLEVSLSRSVEVPSNERLIVEYGDAVNPTTRGIYPVSVQLRRGTVPQIASGVEAPFAVGGTTSSIATIGPEQPTTLAYGLTVVESTFRGIDGAGVFVAADRAGRIRVSRNRVDGTVGRGVAGSGIVVRAKDAESTFRENDISGTTDGIRVATRDTTSVTATESRIRNTRTGIVVRQTGAFSYHDANITLRENALTDNRLDGVRVRTQGLNVTADIADNAIRGNGRYGIRTSAWAFRDGEIGDNDIVGNADTGVSVRADGVMQTLAVRDNTVADNGGHGVELRSSLVVYRSNVTGNRLANNAGAGLVVASPITHRANLSIADNVVAANSYGVVLRGVMGTTVRDNDIVFNTNRYAEPVTLPGVQPGTGSYVAEGAAGALLNRTAFETPLADLVADPEIAEDLRAFTFGDGSVAVLRTDGSFTRTEEVGALTIRRASGDIPTGTRLSDAGSVDNYRFTGNGIYGQERGLTVDTQPLITTDTRALLLTESSRTVAAESNYWGSPRGPYHSSILPGGEGNAVVTAQGWVDIVPFREAPSSTEYSRPTAAIDAPTAPAPGGEVRVSGDGSTSDQGMIVWYRYRINGTAQPASDSPTRTFEMPTGRVEVALGVEDALGIDSDTALITLEPGSATPTATSEPETTPRVTTTAAPGSAPLESGSAPTILGSLGSVWGLLGGVCYFLALVVGVHGTAMTVMNRRPPVDGMQAQGLGALGILIWVGAGLLGPAPLLTVGLAATVVWAALTGAAYVAVTQGLLDDVVE